MLEVNLTTTKIPELFLSSQLSGLPENLQTDFIHADDDTGRRTQDVRTLGFVLSKAWGPQRPACASYSSYEPDENTAATLRRVSNALSALDGVEAGKTSPSHRI
jgi:hypothetical protein